MRSGDADRGESLREQIAVAREKRAQLCVRGGGTRAFYGRTVLRDVLDTRAHRGVIAYEPSELLITARCGTPLAEIEATLAARGQMLAFEPPHFGEETTLGGAIASGLSGPRRASAGAARDFVLGVNMINGRAELLRFGGRVMKNVAGYDVSRLMSGALGTLGVLLDISLKVLPRPQYGLTLVRDCDQRQALDLLAAWGARPLPISASLWHHDMLFLRLSGAESAVNAAAVTIGGEPLQDGQLFWRRARDQQLPFFQRNGRLWRLSLPPATPPLALAGDTLIEWGGAQRWVWSEEPATAIRTMAAAAGGHATLFRGAGAGDEIFHPLPPVLEALHRRLKVAFDPDAILNPGRMYAGI